MKIQSVENCTGCSACFSICERHAISMEENSEGFLFPRINISKCIQCGICDNTCPVLNKLRIRDELPNAYAVNSRDDFIRENSSSGGVFSVIANHFLDEGGVIFGAKLTEDISVIHSAESSISGICALMGAKYVQSFIGETYKNCKSILEEGRKVLFCGTPCQIAGLKAYLNKDYESLLTVDFICHGVPSPLFWQKYIDYRAMKAGVLRQEIVKTSFREKSLGWKDFSLSLIFANNRKFCASLRKDPYLICFLENKNLRKSCYNCQFRTINRVSDITLADFWGIKHLIPEMYDNKGTSLVLTHSKKSNLYINLLKKDCIVCEVDPKEAIKYNPAIIKDCSYPQSRDRFYIDLEKMSFDKFLKKYSSIPIQLKIYRFFMKFFNVLKRKKWRKE